METTELTIVSELTQVIEQTKIERSKAESHAIAFAPSMNDYLLLAENIKGLNKIEPTNDDAKIARENRLKLVKVRTGAEEIKDLRKEGIKAEGDLIQAFYNVVKNSCLVTENEFLEIEKHQERIEEKRKSDLAESRKEQLLKYGTDTSYLPLGVMTDEQFTRLLENELLAFNAKIEAAEKAELARIEAERLAEEARIEKIRIENERIEAERIEAIRVKAELAAKEAELETARKAAEKLAKENEAKLAEQKRLADIETAKQAKILAEQKMEAEKLAAELKAKKDAELAAELAKQQAEKIALAAPDKEKIRILYDSVKGLNVPDLKTDEGKLIVIATNEAIKKLLAEIIKLSKTLK